MQGCFLILNYKDPITTQDAVKHLKRLEGIDDCIIVVYDNGSDNGSLELLSKVYKTDDKVIVGGSKVNRGFSEGNNAAYKLALTRSECDFFDFAVAMNSDVMIHQKDFISRIKRYVDEGEAAVIGPDVYNNHRKKHDNPLFMKIPSAEEMNRMIAENEYLLKNIDEAAANLRISEIKARIGTLLPYWVVNIYRKTRKSDYSDNYAKKHFGIILHGCCLVYLRPYLEQEALLFEPDTFLYGEEILLSIKCNTKGYRLLYDPDLYVEHREAVSTTAVTKTYEERVRRRTENMIHAYNIVKRCIEDNPWE